MTFLTLSKIQRENIWTFLALVQYLALSGVDFTFGDRDGQRGVEALLHTFSISAVS